MGDERKKRVVVVGGGIAGSLLCKNLLLQNHYFDFTLIDSEFYITNLPPQFEFQDNLGKMLKRLGPRGHHEKIQSSESILIVGGGPSGVELAGEIVTDFPGKKVTLVRTSGTKIAQPMFIGENSGKKALIGLIMLEMYTILKNSLDDRGRLMVDVNLRVKGFKNIFAIGDVNDVPELKQGFLAQKHALVVASNLKLLVDGGDEGKMVKYNPASPMAIVSLGRRDALLHAYCVTVIGRVPGWVVQEDDFVMGSVISSNLSSKWHKCRCQFLIQHQPTKLLCRFLFKFTGKYEEINLLGDGTEKPEFGEWSWMSPEVVECVKVVAYCALKVGANTKIIVPITNHLKEEYWDDVEDFIKDDEIVKDMEEQLEKQTMKI
ncbi:apoptosis-inducing factor 2-like protein isoform X2 [Tanacetum coccineum]